MNAAPPPRTVVGKRAKRGDLCVTCPHLDSDPLQHLELCEVVSSNRDGRVTRYALVSGGSRLKARPDQEIGLVSAAQIDVSAAKAAYLARGANFKSKDEAREFLTPFLRK